MPVQQPEATKTTSVPSEGTSTLVDSSVMPDSTEEKDENKGVSAVSTSSSVSPSPNPSPAPSQMDPKDIATAGTVPITTTSSVTPVVPATSVSQPESVNSSVKSEIDDCIDVDAGSTTGRPNFNSSHQM